jgi:chitin disaccharide deacetylase
MFDPLMDSYMILTFFIKPFKERLPGRFLLMVIALFAFSAIGRSQSIQERLGYPKDARLLILHVDDLGVSHSENAASISAMERGCINSASIMVPPPWFLHIAEYAAKNAQRDFGLHITLTSEWNSYKWGPVSPAADVSSLVNKKGFLYSSVDSVKKMAQPDHVEKEIRSQVRRAIQFGVKPTHLDAHMFTAIRKLEFLAAYLKVGREFRIPVFLPREAEEQLQVDLDTIVSDREVIVDHVVTVMPENMSKNVHRFYLESLKNIQPGLTYYIIHTAYDDGEMRAITNGVADWGAAWRQKEYDFFSSDACRKALKENNIYLVTWKEIGDKITRK